MKAWEQQEATLAREHVGSARETVQRGVPSGGNISGWLSTGSGKYFGVKAFSDYVLAGEDTISGVPSEPQTCFVKHNESQWSKIDSSPRRQISRQEKKKNPVQLNGSQADGNVLSTSLSNISDYYIEEPSIITKKKNQIIFLIKKRIFKNFFLFKKRLGDRSKLFPLSSLVHESLIDGWMWVITRVRDDTRNRTFRVNSQSDGKNK